MEMYRNAIKILYLDNTSTFGGAINSLLYLLRALDKSRFVPVLVTAQPEEFLRSKFGFLHWRQMRIKLSWVDNRIYKRVIRIRLLSTGLALKSINCVRFAYWLIFITFPEAIRYWMIGRTERVHIVHLNNILGSQVAGILAAKLLGVPCGAHLRHFEEVDNVTRFLAKMIDFHVAISSSIKDNLISLGVPNEKIAVIYDAIDLEEFDDNLCCASLKDEFNIKGPEKLFGIFGRIVDWKGTKEFINTAALVIRSMPEAIAFVIGDSSDGETKYVDELKSLIAYYGIEQNVILTGYRRDVPALMQLMDVVVHASITPEPFGMVLIEAMAMKKPVVATKKGGPLDIVENGRTGILVEPGNAQDMAEAVLLLLRDDNIATTMGRHGKSRVQSMFTSERYARQVEEVYSKQLNF